MRDGRVRLLFAGDEREFRLGIENLLALEDACDSPLGEIIARLASGGWRVRDVRETLRLGLLGGGADPEAARRLVDLGAGAGRLMAASLTARVVLGAALIGEDAEDAAGKGARADAPEADASPPAPSSEPGPSSDSRPPRLDA